MTDTVAPAKHPGNAQSHYEESLEFARASISLLKQHFMRFVWLRIVLFGIALVCLVLGYGGESFRVTLICVGWLSAAAFFAAIVWHEHLRLEQMDHESDQQLFAHLISRLNRDWNQLPDVPLLDEFASLAYADDLDIGGNASLLSLVSLAGTLPGKRTLQSWIATPTVWATVQERQNAVQELVRARELRLKIVKLVHAGNHGSNTVYGLPEWGQSPNWLPRHKIAHALSYVGPALVIAGAVSVLAVAGQESATLTNAAACILGVGFVLNILVTVFWGSWIHDIFLDVAGEHRASVRFTDVFESLSDLPQGDKLLDRIRAVAVQESHCATTGFSKLMRLVRLATMQRDPLQYILYLVLQLLFLWDFRILKLLERWKSRFGEHVHGWFAALGECEALISCAIIADEYPDWTFPEPPVGNEINIDAEGLGHPLLADNARVQNDFRLTTAQPLLLVTGSNMAGKSTLMRAVGLNVVLARTGSPVCARRLRCPMFELGTSICVRDSLRDGVSFFMAELHRLKDVVDLAQDSAKQIDLGHAMPPVLFLLDEVLQGTNSRERQIAVATVLDKLLKSGATGLVSTHDLDLANADEIKSVSQIVHFREFFEFDGEREIMRFDYKMRPGPTPTTNALKLLKLVGLGQED